jgi:uncharacterized coiled-coil DUF342 family protein
MAIDNSLYDSLENTYIKIQNYFDNNKLGPEHSLMIVKHEELADLLESFDIEAIEEQSKDIHALHAQLTDIKTDSNKVLENLNEAEDSVVTAEKVVSGLDKIFSKITNVVV